ncbi:MAG TPA: hypothetical protein VF095_11480 [Bacillota bacterium]
MTHLEKKKRQKTTLFSCQTCSVSQTGKKTKKSWLPNICIGHVGLLLTAVFILIMQLAQ